ncbi:MAG: hypothetical protein J2P37_29910 [Ktedonobacteraceae bacterium]|nr:hypothetical protein [Ktedonobacteraceae bacterium]
MKRRLLLLLALFILSSGFVVVGAQPASASSSRCVDPGGTKTLQGTLQGANYTIAVPANWNGTLLLYSHGYVSPTSPILNPAPDAGDALTGNTLLQQGYALAGSSYSSNGWALQQAFHDQVALLDYFNSICGHPTRTIPWGHSLGGIITAGLVQLYPERFTAAMPMCGVLSGGVATWNQALDSSFAFQTLLANNVPIVHITDPGTSLQQAENILAAAQKTPEGKARIALAAALADIPGWFDAASPEPARTDFATQEQNQFLWESQVDFFFAFIARAELEARAGGNPSWNIGVNYSRQLKLSTNRHEVEALYKQAGLSLDGDLATLNHARRIQADPQAVVYLNKYITFNGDLNVPTLGVHTTGDGLVVNQNEQAYADVVHDNGDSRMLRQIFVHRAGHCTFTPAETLAAFQALFSRVTRGFWDGATSPERLNRTAAALGPTFNQAPPSYINFQPTLFLRPFSAHHRA